MLRVSDGEPRKLRDHFLREVDASELIDENHRGRESVWGEYFAKIGSADERLMQRFPDFLVISPARTGTAWLSHNLGSHQQIFVPRQKEVKFFCTNWQWCDINWYLRQFPEGRDWTKGELSPTYALLPSFVIRFIHSLNPRLKLIILLRDPVARAWSHTKHTYRYHEANFLHYRGDFNIPISKFYENFVDDYLLSSSDYWGIMRRWSEVFPKQNFFVRFFEEIIHSPAEMLRDVFEFLGVSRDDLAAFREAEKFEGLEAACPPEVERHLRRLYRPRATELCRWLEDEWGLKAPPEWNNTLLGDEREGPVLLEPGYLGHDLYLHAGRFYALPATVDPQILRWAGLLGEASGTTFIRAEALFDLRYRLRKALTSSDLCVPDTPAAVADKRLQSVLLRESGSMIRRALLALKDGFENPVEATDAGGTALTQSFKDAWCNIDQAGDPESFVQFINGARGGVFESPHHYQQLIGPLGVRPGQHLLEVGCGFGCCTRVLAKLVGPGGRVVGVDISKTMIDEARQRSEGSGLPVDFRVEDAHHLPFLDNMFDGCYAQETLEIIDNPRQVLVEMIRVAKPGARIVIPVALDFGATVIDSPDRDLTRKIIDFVCDHELNGWLGRQLPGLFKELGLKDVNVTADTGFMKFPVVRKYWLQTYVDHAQMAGVVSAEEATRWFSELEQADRAGRFFWAWTTFTTSGRKPL